MPAIAYCTTRERTACLIPAILAMIMTLPSISFADDSRDSNPANGLSVEVELRHQVEIPQILFFRIGSISAVEEVSFDLSQTQTLQSNNSNYDGTALFLGDGSPIDATSNGDLSVYLISNVAPVDISYTVSNPNGLDNGIGNFIAYDQITTQSDDAGLSAPILDNAAGNAVTVSGNNFGGLVADYRNVTWTYRYANDQVPVAGTYTGRVTYTASAP